MRKVCYDTLFTDFNASCARRTQFIPPASAEKAKFAKDPSTSASARLNGDDDDEDTIASRFVSRLLKWLFQGFIAKNKTTRYRSVCIVSEMISHLGEIEQVNLFNEITTTYLFIPVKTHTVSFVTA